MSDDPPKSIKTDPLTHEIRDVNEQYTMNDLAYNMIQQNHKGVKKQMRLDTELKISEDSPFYFV